MMQLNLQEINLITSISLVTGLHQLNKFYFPRIFLSRLITDLLMDWVLDMGDAFYVARNVGYTGILSLLDSVHDSSKRFGLQINVQKTNTITIEKLPKEL